MADVIILGNGPAGISAALYTARAGIKTMVIGRDGGSLEKTDKIENYYGFSEPVPAKDLIQNGIKQAERLGIEMLSGEVVGMAYTGKFVVQTKTGEYEAESVILATGSSRKSPPIEGLQGRLREKGSATAPFAMRFSTVASRWPYWATGNMRCMRRWSFCRL